MSTRYRCSEEMLERALLTIPLGSQTFSKSRTQYPWGVSPYFAQRAEGCRLWDVDGNEYIDFVNSLAAITLGYNDPDVTAAVKAQLDEGVIFSLPHPVEVEVAERIVEMIPCADMARFGKNGSDATAGAVRVARAFTGRDHVAMCGYHGWQDWCIGATPRNLGVPQATRDLTHTFEYENLDSLRSVFVEHPGEVAAVIMEPMNVRMPREGYLEELAEFVRDQGAVLIFDETVTGFRLANGGAQELLGVIPDLATYGKGVANGYPISVVAGRGDIMKLMEEVFFSFTFGGETLSLAAAKATMDKLRREPVLATMAARGSRLLAGLREVLERHGAVELIGLSGHSVWSFLSFPDLPEASSWELKTLFLQEMFARGILILGSHNMSYAHQDSDIDLLLRAYDEVVPILVDAVASSSVREALACEPLVPLFKIR